jgi:pimeloyl-ACP methyl ester carboxylesterase
MSISKNLILLLLSGLALKCQEPVETKAPDESIHAGKKYFVSASPGDGTSRTTLQLLAAGLGQSELAQLLQYDVETYTIVYNTVYKGEPVEASGLIMVPKEMVEAAPLVSLQHGTIFRKDEAPSVRGGFQGVEFFASAGYVTLMPDYLGYGSSSHIFHPYYDSEHSAATVIDLIKAAKEFLAKEEVAFNEELFLAGYSEGGYVTLAAAKEIETDPIHGLSVTAIAAGAGGYDLTEMLTSITSSDYYAYPGYLAFVLKSYHHTYGWKMPLSHFFREKYADAILKFVDGEHGGGYINSQLTTHVPSLFNPSFLENLAKTDGETELKNALILNSTAGWKTDTPVRLYHGTRDEIIPFQNSEKTLANFKAAGSDGVTLTAIPNGTHGSSFEPMLRDFIPWFLSF